MGRLDWDLNSKTLEHTGIRDNLHSTTQLPYIIFCSGMSRSASSWSYKTCKTLVRLRTPENKIDCGYLNEADTFADAYVSTKMKSGYDALIYFSHVINKRALRMILCGIAKNVYTYRDPRDSIASIMRNKGCKYGPAFDFVHSSLLLFNLFAADQYSLLLPFPETLKDPLGTTAKIADYLDYDLSREQIEKVHLKTQRLAIDRRNEQRRKSAYSALDIEIIDHGLEVLEGEPTDAPAVNNPWRYSALNKNQYADATKRLLNWLIKMNFPTSPVPRWGGN